MTEPTPLMTEGDRIEAYVLGLMEPHEHERFEASMARDPGLARRVAALADRLMALDWTAEHQKVPGGLWDRIANQLDAPVQAPPGRAREHAGPVPHDGVPRWRGWAAAAGVVLALGVGFLGGLALQPGAPAPLVIAILADETQAPGAIVEAYGDDRVRIVPLEAFAAGEDQVLEVWTLPPQAQGPVSLGTFERASELVLEGPDLPDPRSGQLYEITLEPAGGSPIGRPTGPVLYLGHARQPVT